MNIELPEPWFESPLGDLPDSVKSALSKAASFFKPIYSLDTTPRGESQSVSRWFKVMNRKNGMSVLIELTKDLRPGSSYSYIATSVFFVSAGPFDGISGSELRELPLRTICNAYASAYVGNDIKKNRAIALQGDNEFGSVDALSPLPKQDKTSYFYAKVGEQFEAIRTKFPNENTAQKMSELNSVPLSTMQRWITDSRKRQFLLPARWVK